MSRCSICYGISPKDEAVLQEAIAEAAHSSPSLDFVFSGQGIQLSSAFLQIGDRIMRRDVMAMIEGIGRVSGNKAFHFRLTLSWLVGLYIAP